MTSQQKIDAFMHELGQAVDGEVRTGLYDRLLYSTDASIYQVVPHGVLIPHTAEDLHTAVNLAALHHIPVLPRTGGSSLAGQAINEALIIDTTRHLDHILEINPDEQWARVQPGVVLDHLNTALVPHGLKFGPDPASSNRACLGGIVGNNSTGAHSILYGLAVDHVLETKVLLSDGTEAHFRPLSPAELAQHQQKTGLEGHIYRQINSLVWNPTNREAIRQGTPRHWRRCGGYNLARFVTDGTIDHYVPLADERFNLAQLMVGSEGTLGMLTEIKVKLVQRPTHTAVALIEFADLNTALRAVPHLLETNPSAIELLDNLGLTMAKEVPTYARLLRSFMQGDPYCILITEFYGTSDAELRHKLDELAQKITREKLQATAVTQLLDPVQQAAVWQVRKGGLGLLMSVRSDYKPLPFIEDTAVPVQHLADYVPRLEKFCAELGSKMVYYAHASAGCLHIRPLINIKRGDEIEKMPRIQEFALSLLHEYGGALSSEHGDGRARSWLNKAFYGPELYGLYQDVKRIFDPHNLFNPGNIVDAPPMTESLRYGAGYISQPVALHLDFAEGFDTAVEMCNGAGVCRQTNTGSMCPSFMVTREEEDSTRGRANMLRAALSGRLPAGQLTSPRMYDVMSLCVSCKACKSECPSSVDMAKIKTEFLAQYYETHRHPLRDHLFANFASLAKIASGPFAPLLNAGSNLPPVKSLLARSLGISAERTLPQFARQSFVASFNSRHRPAALSQTAHAQDAVVLFPDALNNFVYPEVAIAATELLEAAGYRVIVPEVTDAGRAAFSKGLVDVARNTAVALINTLSHYAVQGIPLIFLEPSDLSMITDDYFALLPRDERLPLVSKMALSLEQFVVQAAAQGVFDGLFTAEPRTDFARPLPPKGAHRGDAQLAGVVASAQLQRVAHRFGLLWHGWFVWL
ncbi:MAG: FAD-binding protein [Anaerolineales bacterium]|nr:FAD-binding protein [Anaerolineales bacterium]